MKIVNKWLFQLCSVKKVSDIFLMYTAPQKLSKIDTAPYKLGKHH